MAKLKETNVRENLFVKGNIYVYDYELEEYRLLFAPATENTLGGIIVGENLSIDVRGVLNSIRQPVDIELSTLSANPVENQTITKALATKVDKSIVSEYASETNKLMDREQVETLVQSNNAVFRGVFDNWASVPIDSSQYEPDDDGNRTPKKGDYISINDASDYHEGGASGKIGSWRFIYSKSWNTAGKGGWKPHYKFADYFDSKQKAAINSGITAAKVEAYDGYAAQIQNKSNIGHTHGASDINGLKPLAISGEFSDLYNVPTAGNTTTPIYFGTDPNTKTGRPYACSFSIPNPISGKIGDISKPVYFKLIDGVMQPTVCDIEIPKGTGSSSKPVYIDENGKFVPCDQGIGIKCIEDQTSKAYICGFLSNSTSQETNRLIYDSNIYIDTEVGKISATVFNGTATAALYSDYAEWFPRGGKTEPGDIIALDENANDEKYIKATKNSICIVGVESNEFGYSVGGCEVPNGVDYREYLKKDFIPVGLAGRVHVKFIGPAKKGAKVVISDVAGIGKMQTDIDMYSQVIGYLVESDNQVDLRLLKIKIL